MKRINWTLIPCIQPMDYTDLMNMLCDADLNAILPIRERSKVKLGFAWLGEYNAKLDEVIAEVPNE